ncbi:Uma2 family endonuclease [Streptomyces shenzhenensis]|uniref:Uma2 family endonuclease n=1 Tax=Streptomyces shenzhenensis TaxID=943815 RepID=UPI0015F08D71|nr:Uma2 family endonuclease [Streptomyces shenzhenensis]
MSTDHHQAAPAPLTGLEPVRLLAAYEAVSPMPVRPEFLEGRACVPQSPPDHGHNGTVMSLLVRFRSAGVQHSGTGNGYRFTDGTGDTSALLVPDLYVKHRKPTASDESHYARYPGWYPGGLLALVGEVTSTNHETDTGPKFRTYAAAGIPVYVLIDRHTKTAHCYTDPVLPGNDPTEAYYQTDEKVNLGDPLPLPAPYPTLDTGPFRGD